MEPSIPDRLSEILDAVMQGVRVRFSVLLAMLLAASCVSAAADARVADDVLGTWSGAATFRGQPLAMSVRFTRERGLLRGTISAADIALLEQPLADVAHDSGRIYFSLTDAEGSLVFRGAQTG